MARAKSKSTKPKAKPVKAAKLAKARPKAAKGKAMGTYKLYGAKGGGSMIVEAAFTVAKVPVEFIDLEWDEIGWDSKILGPLNPLGQVPTLVMPDGSVMTESAAMILHLSEISPSSNLAPPAGDPLRPAFLRWLVFIVSAVYPTFTYGDTPQRWLQGDVEAGKKLRTVTDEHRKMLWKHVESQIKGPWFLGERWSALDIYMWPMSLWRPGKDWLKAECPKLYKIAVESAKHPASKQAAERIGL